DEPLAGNVKVIGLAALAIVDGDWNGEQPPRRGAGRLEIDPGWFDPDRTRFLRPFAAARNLNAGRCVVDARTDRLERPVSHLGVGVVGTEGDGLVLHTPRPFRHLSQQ